MYPVTGYDRFLIRAHILDINAGHLTRLRALTGDSVSHMLKFRTCSLETIEEAGRDFPHFSETIVIGNLCRQGIWKIYISTSTYFNIILQQRIKRAFERFPLILQVMSIQGYTPIWLCLV